MKKLFIVAAGASLFMTSCNSGVGNVTLKDQQDSVSYALGSLIGQGVLNQFKQLPFDTVDAGYLLKALANSKPSEQYLKAVQPQLDTIYCDLFMTALRNRIANGETFMPDEQANAFLMAKSEAKRKENEAKREAQAAKNEAEGAAFMEEHAKEEGVKTLPCGIQYTVITEGTGAKPAENDKVKVNYRGTLLDGTEFDASKPDTPATLSLRSVIRGWKEALVEMPIGSKWQVVIPDSLAYGKRGAGEKIAPGATLIFDIELVDVVKPSTPASKKKK